MMMIMIMIMITMMIMIMIIMMIMMMTMMMMMMMIPMMANADPKLMKHGTVNDGKMGYGSSRSKWPEIARRAKDSDLLFVPSVGPGYDDSPVRPWNVEHTRSRQKGRYYQTAWKAVLSLTPAPSIISVTSFNEWHEGTQIEAAIPITFSSHPSYSPYGQIETIETGEEGDMERRNGVDEMISGFSGPSGGPTGAGGEAHEITIVDHICEQDGSPCAYLDATRAFVSQFCAGKRHVAS